ncbi:MAG: outer membrane protein OmpA-like peptidoglycan-associated protein [Candidatus Azotimanducaceae bacterium]|jgi:outer membrane protein OmpA-like peptidoglycan-associated protein
MCQLNHKISAFGSGQFEHEAGEAQALLLLGDGYKFSAKPVTVISEPPNWRPGELPKILGEVAAKEGEVRISGDLVTQLLSELTQGDLIAFKGKVIETNNEPMDVYLSAVGLKNAFETYKRCEANLLSVNYRQLERSRIQYASGKYEIPADGKLLLDKMAEYLKVDMSVEQIFIDGHTDAIGLKKDNVSVSEKRAIEVTNYLLSSGVSPEKIVTRFHGERYPVVKNDTLKHKAKNRRTTIRLSKKKKQDVP